MPDSEGIYKPGRLPTFFEDPDRCGHLIYSGQAGSRVAGTHLRVMTQARAPGTLGVSMNRLTAEALP